MNQSINQYKSHICIAPYSTEVHRSSV